MKVISLRIPVLKLLTVLSLVTAGPGLISTVRSFEIDGRWGDTASDSNTGSLGDPITLTWGFVDDGTTISGNEGSSGSDLINFLDTHVGIDPNSSELTDRPWFSLFEDSFSRFGEVSGVSYLYEPNNSSQAINSSARPEGRLGSRPDVRIGGHSIDGQSSHNTLAYSYFPDHSDMVIDTDNTSLLSNTANEYRLFRNVILHESGHGLGFSHIESNNAALLMEQFITTAFDGPQLDDILALHRNYGDAWEKMGGNDSSGTSVDLGSLNGAGTIGIGTLGDSTLVSVGQMDFISIDDNSDTDFFQFSLENTLQVTLDLTPRGATYNEAPQGGEQTSLNTKNLSDLTLALLDTNGSSVLELANANGVGSAESITRNLDAGTYFARVTGTHNDVQLYGLDVLGIPIPADLTWSGNQSSAWDVDTTANFDDSGGAAVFHAFDQVTFDDTASTFSVTLSEDVQPSSTLVHTAATYMFSGPGAIVGGSLTITGGGTLELTNDGNAYSGNTDVLDGTLVITGNAETMVSAITIASGSTVVMDSSDAGGMGSAFHVEDGGTLQIGTNTSTTNVFPDGLLSIVNNGEIRVFDYEVLKNISGSGPIIADEETTFLGDNFAFDGEVIATSGGTIDVDHPNAFGTAIMGTTVNDGGEVKIDLTAVLNEPFNLTGNGSGNGALRIDDNSTVELTGGIIMNGATAQLTVGGGSTLLLNSAVTAAADGTLTLQLDHAGKATLNDSLNLGAGGLVKQGAGVAELVGQGNFSGTSDVQDGTLIVTGATGTGDTMVQNGGTLTGDGTIASNLIAQSGATIRPENAQPQVPTSGSLQVVGDYTQLPGATLKIELADVTAFESLIVNGTATLNGVLEVLLDGGFTPSLGDTFEILTSTDGVTDAFETTFFPYLGTELTMDVLYTSTNVTLAVVSVPSDLSGDFDVDGDVDGFDFLTQQIDPSVGTLSDWEANYGMVSTLSAASAWVPEPNSLALFGWGCVLALLNFRRVTAFTATS